MSNPRFWRLLILVSLSSAAFAPRGTTGKSPGSMINPRLRMPTGINGVAPGAILSSRAESPGPRGLTEAQLKKKWRVEMGPGYPGPVCNGELVFSAATLDKAREEVFAFDKRMGKRFGVCPGRER